LITWPYGDDLGIMKFEITVECKAKVRNMADQWTEALLSGVTLWVRRGTYHVSTTSHFSSVVFVNRVMGHDGPRRSPPGWGRQAVHGMAKEPAPLLHGY